jgi:plasmid stability protein
VPDVLVRGVPREVLDILKRTAATNHRSLQQELVLILEQAARKDCSKAVEAATIIREHLSEYGRSYSDSVRLIREDRDR